MATAVDSTRGGSYGRWVSGAVLRTRNRAAMDAADGISGGIYLVAEVLPEKRDVELAVTHLYWCNVNYIYNHQVEFLTAVRTNYIEAWFLLI
jgi:hypothetical protein